MNKILVLSLMAVLTSSNTFAASSGSCGTGCTYTLDDKGLLTVTGTGENASVDSNKFYGNSQVKNIVIKGSIKTIGTDAFHSINADSIDMGDSQVVTIGQGAFYENRSLSSLKFSPTLETIQYGAFKNGSMLIDELVFPDTTKNIGKQAFAWGWKVKNIYIPESIESISSEYPITSGSIEHIYCPESKKTLCENAFIKSSSSYLPNAQFKTYTKNGDFYIVDGKKYASLSDMGAGKEYHDVKRIYTVEEATEAAKGNKNTFSIKYR